MASVKETEDVKLWPMAANKATYRAKDDRSLLAYLIAGTAVNLPIMLVFLAAPYGVGVALVSLLS